MSDGTTSTDLGTLGGTVTIPQAINDAGEIVGQSRTLPRTSSPSGITAERWNHIDPAGSTMGWDDRHQRDRGQILGSYRDSSGIDNAYPLRPWDLDTDPQHGQWLHITRTAINNRGQVVGSVNTAGSGFASHASSSTTETRSTSTTPSRSGYEAVI